jgi:dipeptide/tripeptide permease
MTMATSVDKDARQNPVIPVLFTATIFTSALLLFFVQPLFTRMVLPQIGGAPAVWTTAMLFFQTVLIGGYLYAHLMTRHVPLLAQVGIHVALLVLALMVLPLAVPAGWQYDPARPVVTQTLWLYTLGVGLPFAVLSANAPLIQSWYRRSGGPSADDPYFLYAASNLGSLVALLAFPLVAEPLFGVTAISGAWSVGFMALGPLLLLSGLAARKGTPRESEIGSPTSDAAAPGLRLLGYWAFLAFLPSSLMLCVTSKISTDLGSFPLVWVVPLALYLLTFVLVFSSRSPLTADRLRRVLPLALAVLVFFSLRPTATLTWIALFLLAFFAVSLLAHRLLFDARPDSRHLTVFYLTMSVGGALGGLFNSIFAPLVFDRLLEYPITVALIALLMIRRPLANAPRDIAMGLGLAMLALLPLLLDIAALHRIGSVNKTLLTVCILLITYALFRARPTVSVAATATLIGVWALFGTANVLMIDRSFFGVHMVSVRGDIREYRNGTTVHGAQLVSETSGRPTPLTYYHPKGLMAQIVTDVRKTPARTVGIIGLGTGALACYAKPGQDWHFYEIDQMVVDIALTPQLFSFMSACASDAKIHVGDARIVLQGQTDLKYDILVIDAYSSDAIPVHLATAEAIQLYLDRLNEGGILVFHVSNRFYDLAQPLSVAAKALGLVGRYRVQGPDELKDAVGANPSMVVTLARTTEALGISATDPAWGPLPEPRIRLWTDDYANLLAALQ